MRGKYNCNKHGIKFHTLGLVNKAMRCLLDSMHHASCNMPLDSKSFSGESPGGKSPDGNHPSLGQFFSISQVVAVQIGQISPSLVSIAISGVLGVLIDQVLR